VSLPAEGDRHIVTARVTGSLAGSPVLIDHAFCLADGAIRSLEIG
jgi:hypothetical protein